MWIMTITISLRGAMIAVNNLTFTEMAETLVSFQFTTIFYFKMVGTELIGAFMCFPILHLQFSIFWINPEIMWIMTVTISFRGAMKVVNNCTSTETFWSRCFFLGYISKVSNLFHVRCFFDNLNQKIPNLSVFEKFSVWYTCHAVERTKQITFYIDEDYICLFTRKFFKYRIKLNALIGRIMAYINDH